MEPVPAAADLLADEKSLAGRVAVIGAAFAVVLLLSRPVVRMGRWRGLAGRRSGTSRWRGRRWDLSGGGRQSLPRLPASSANASPCRYLRTSFLAARTYYATVPNMGLALDRSGKDRWAVVSSRPMRCGICPHQLREELPPVAPSVIYPGTEPAPPAAASALLPWLPHPY